MGEWEGRRELRSGTFRSRAPAPNSPAHGRDSTPSHFRSAGHAQPPRSRSAIRFAEFSQKSRLSSAGDQHNGVSGSTWIPPPCWIPSATSCFGCPGWPGHRNRDGTSNTSEEIACRAFENIYSRNFPRNNAVFHPVPSFPRTGYSDNKLGDDKPPPFRSHIPRNSRTCCNFISSFFFISNAEGKRIEFLTEFPRSANLPGRISPQGSTGTPRRLSNEEEFADPWS